MDELKEETVKWQEKLEKEVEDIEPESEDGEEFIKNINSYLSDSYYFKEEGDYVRSFECVIWSWAWLEIGERYNFLRKR
ncbi:MAG: hypothetical protein BTN85_0080 [Candidatus Methanohalarchaeum thermophilum]|uniref:DUF357 domain-containing protein n=1 Tax=Methanohalarchaeum thermophilum TaxID=1903181 RepID=A0A1Q6DTF9_METT1|nr:MAG: hypothetical protein BTN85_0080 [Candidatus Methanohalarchaeum thermophilum]